MNPSEAAGMEGGTREYKEMTGVQGAVYRLHNAHRSIYMFSHKSSLKMSRKLGQRQDVRCLVFFWKKPELAEDPGKLRHIGISSWRQSNG